jgi:hypothetical protein
MHKFEVKYSLQGKVVLVLLVLPILWMIPLLVIFTLIPDLPGWAIPVLTILVLTGAIISTIRFIGKYINVPCVVTMNEDKLEIELLRHSFLYTITHYESPWSNIENVSSNIDTKNNKRFYQVRFQNPGKIITLGSNESINTVSDETAFGKTLLDFVDKFNKTETASSFKIHSNGFYDSWWAKLLTFFAWTMTALIIVVSFTKPGSINIWKVLGFFAYCVIWLTAYYTNRKKK